MVTDKIENLGSYPQLEKYQKEIEEFIKALDMQELEEGRYVLREDTLIALVQKYHTRDKDSSRMESHKKYADLQYIHKGEEMIYTDRVEELEVEAEIWQEDQEKLLQEAKASPQDPETQRRLSLLEEENAGLKAAAQDARELAETISRLAAENASLKETAVENGGTEELQRLKIHPADQEENRLVLARGERIYTESLGPVREQTGRCLAYLREAMDSQSPTRIRRAREESTRFFDAVEQQFLDGVKIKGKAPV